VERGKKQLSDESLAVDAASWTRFVDSPVDLVLTVAVDAGVAEALVDLGEAGGVLVAVWTRAGEAVDAVDAGAAVVAGVDGTLVDVNVTHGA